MALALKASILGRLLIDVLSDDVAGAWGHSEGISDGTFTVADGKVCFGLKATRRQTFWWPTRPELELRFEEGTPYSVFFRASAEGPLRLHLNVSVGHGVRSDTPAVEAEAGAIGAGGWYRVDFVPGKTDERAGFHFEISSNPARGESRFCLSDLLVVRREILAPDRKRGHGSNSDSSDTE